MAMKGLLPITEASPSGDLVSYPGYLLGGSYPSADMQPVYFIAPANWTTTNDIYANQNQYEKIRDIKFSLTFRCKWIKARQQDLSLISKNKTTHVGHFFNWIFLFQQITMWKMKEREKLYKYQDLASAL